MHSSSRRKRIAILGGGVASLATAFELTSRPGFAETYELTVYQQGHRLGGKAASSRTRSADGVQRIEEHGLHMFFGFYENAFDLMRRTYDELSALPYEPGETWRLGLDEAFQPHDLIMLGSTYQGRSRSWALPFPRRDGKPGLRGDTRGERNATEIDMGSILSGLLELMVAQLLNVADVEVDGLGPVQTGSGGLADELEGIRQRGRDGEDIVTDMLEVLMSMRRLLQGQVAPRLLVSLLRALQATVGALGDHPMLRNSHVRTLLASTLGLVRDQSLAFVLASFPDEFRVHQLRVSLDLFFTVAVGLLRDDMLHDRADWFALDELDYRSWMRKHGAREETVHSAPLLTLADATFSDPKSAGAGAGTTLHLTLRMLLTYKEAIVFRLGAGMGETVVAPLYRVLEARGVRFKFFHRLERLIPGVRDGKPVVEAVEFRRQAHVRAGEDRYRPLEAFADGVLCFPVAPDYQQLVEGDLLKARAVDLEDSWNRWDATRPVERLWLGKDYDAVVLGVSLGGLAMLCEPLAKAQQAHEAPLRGSTRRAPKLEAMLKNVRTVETMAAQLWFKPTFPALRGPSAGGVGVEYPQPFDTWSEMNHLLPHESWPDQQPGTLVYLCSAVDEPAGYRPPPFSDHEHTARRKQEVKHLVRRWLDLHGGRVFAGAQSFGQFDYELLVDPKERTGRARFDAQFWCATSNPSDRYVLSAPGTSRFRLRPHESGYENLVFTGDWTLNAISAGCVEGTVMSGKEAARALLGQPSQIVGDWLTRVHPELLCRPILPALPVYAPAPASELHVVAASPRAVSNDNARANDDPASSGTRLMSAAYRLPRIHRRAFDVQTAPPALCKGARVDWFFFAADKTALSAAVAELNHPDSPTLYEPLLPVVAFVASQVARISGGSDRSGYIPERDYAFWIPVRASARPGREQDNTASPIAWYQPCLWVDSCPAVVGGRETFGMNKVLGQLRAPTNQEPLFSIDTIAIKRQGPDARAEMARVLELQVEGGADMGAELSSLTDLLEDASLLDTLKVQASMASHALANLLTQLTPRVLPIVALKQFADVERPELACYKAVVEAPSHPQGRVSVRRWPGSHQLRIYPFESHPISRTLGLQVSLREGPQGPVEVVAPFFALRSELDFVLQPGRVLFDFVAAEQARLGLAVAEVG